VPTGASFDPQGANAVPCGKRPPWQDLTSLLLAGVVLWPAEVALRVRTFPVPAPFWCAVLRHSPVLPRFACFQAQLSCHNLRRKSRKGSTSHPAVRASAKRLYAVLLWNRYNRTVLKRLPTCDDARGPAPLKIPSDTLRFSRIARKVQGAAQFPMDAEVFHIPANPVLESADGPCRPEPAFSEFAGDALRTLHPVAALKLHPGLSPYSVPGHCNGTRSSCPRANHVHSATFPG